MRNPDPAIKCASEFLEQTWLLQYFTPLFCCCKETTTTTAIMITNKSIAISFDWCVNRDLLAKSHNELRTWFVQELLSFFFQILSSRQITSTWLLRVSMMAKKCFFSFLFLFSTNISNEIWMTSNVETYIFPHFFHENFDDFFFFFLKFWRLCKHFHRQQHLVSFFLSSSTIQKILYKNNKKIKSWKLLQIPLFLSQL